MTGRLGTAASVLGAILLGTAGVTGNAVIVPSGTITLATTTAHISEVRVAVGVLVLSGSAPTVAVAGVAYPAVGDVQLQGRAPTLVYGWTKFYLTNRTATYTPATLRGAWDDTAAVVTKLLETGPIVSLPTDDTTYVERAETNASNTWDVLLYRGVTGPLAAQTVAGNVNVCVPVRCYFSNGNFKFHVHIYATQGDSDTPRGTLLSDYIDADDWNVNPEIGSDFNSAQALSSLALTEGDRIVIEIGYRAANSDTTSRTGRLVYGWEPKLAEVKDLALDQYSNPGGTSLAGFVEFQSAIAPSTAITGRVSQEPVLALVRPTQPEGRVSQEPVLALVRPAAPEGRVSQLPVLVLVRPNVFFPASGTIALTGQAPSLGLGVLIPSGGIGLDGQPVGTGGPASGLIQLIGQPPTLALTVLIPSGQILIVSDPPTVTVSAGATVIDTQAGVLVATQPTGPPAALVTQTGAIELDQATVDAQASQAGALVQLQHPSIEALNTQAGVLVLIRTWPEIAPEIGTNFGPLVWVEWTGPDGSLPVWAPVDLPDPSTYYRGYKSPLLLRPGIVHRALSDEDGQVQSQSFEAEISDIDRPLRALLGRTDAQRHLVNTLMVMRMISDEARRLQLTPRTVAIGIVRSYELG